MRIKLEIDLKGNRLPKEYRRSIISFFKHSVESYHKETFNELYDKTAHVSKSYTFATAFPTGTQFEKDCVVLPNPSFTMLFSTSNLKDLVVFYNAFLAQRNREFPLPAGNSMRLIRIDYVNVPPIFRQAIKVQMLAPLVLRLHNRETNWDEYVSHEDERFDDVFRETTKLQLENMGICADVSDLHIKAEKAKRIIISEFGTKYTGNLGVFTLTGSVEVLNVLQDSGAGSRRNAGNGMFKVIG